MISMASEPRINCRTTLDIKRDLPIAARLRGLSVSALVNSAVVRIIREEKERDPQAFNGNIQLEPAELRRIPSLGKMTKEQGVNKTVKAGSR